MGKSDKTNKTNGGGEVFGDFARKRFATDRVKVDHETGMVNVPGVGPLPLVGPTSGREYKNLKEAEAQFELDRAKLNQDRAKRWQCVQCKRIWRGGKVRVKKLNPASDQVYYVCPDKQCDAPVIEYTGPKGTTRQS